MSKSLRNCFDKKLTFEKLLEAEKRTRKNKSNKREVLEFEMDLESNIISILKELKEGIYKLGKYREFKIFEPKERIIKSLPYKDRIVQQWYVEEFIKPFFVPRMINDSYACIEGRGTHKAVDKVQRYMKRMKKEFPNYYVLQCDIRKFFFSINRNKLYEILKRKIKDKKLLELTRKFIFDNEDSTSIPIGNYTSQYFGNIYLNELDWYIKNKLKVKYYVRYLDDFIVLCRSKEEGRGLKEKIRIFLETLGLEYNPKSRYYPSRLGIDFCGYRIFEEYRLVRKRSKKKIKENIRLWKKLKSEGKLDKKKMEQSYRSWLGHIKHANSYYLRVNIECRLEKLDKEISNFFYKEKQETRKF